MKNLTEEQRVTAVNAINTLIYYISNYDYALDETTNTYIPAIFIKAKWGCSWRHIYGKWEHYVERRNGDTAMAFIDMYYELDNGNKSVMLNWVLDNYHTRNLESI